MGSGKAGELAGWHPASGGGSMRSDDVSERWTVAKVLISIGGGIFMAGMAAGAFLGSYRLFGYGYLIGATIFCSGGVLNAEGRGAWSTLGMRVLCAIFAVAHGAFFLYLLSEP